MRFCFKVLDINNDGKISESDLFTIMKWCTIKKPLTNEDDTLPIDGSNPSLNRDQDMFLELFSADFCKIIKQINFKRKIKGKDD